MSDQFQAEPPRPRRDWGDDADARPVQRRSDGLPVWAWLLIGLGAVSMCLVPAVLAMGLFLFRATTSAPPAPMAPAPVETPAPEKEHAP
jgi:hypothetical protein